MKYLCCCHLLSVRCVCSFQNKDLLEIVRFLATNTQNGWIRLLKFQVPEVLKCFYFLSEKISKLLKIDRNLRIINSWETSSTGIHRVFCRSLPDKALLKQNIALNRKMVKNKNCFGFLCVSCSPIISWLLKRLILREGT